jgi:hypothetical protein
METGNITRPAVPHVNRVFPSLKERPHWELFHANSRDFFKCLILIDEKSLGLATFQGSWMEKSPVWLLLKVAA